VAERKSVLLRLDPAVYDALTRWAGDELRSTTAQIELLLRRALADAGRLPPNVGGLPKRGRPPKSAPEPEPEPEPDADPDPDAQDQAAGPP
jgi:hypothetical protein